MAKQNSSDMVTITVPREAWDILEKSLRLDANSSASTRDLREEIAGALAKVNVTEKPHIYVFVRGGVVQAVYAENLSGVTAEVADADVGWGICESDDIEERDEVRELVNDLERRAEAGEIVDILGE